MSCRVHIKQAISLQVYWNLLPEFKDLLIVKSFTDFSLIGGMGEVHQKYRNSSELLGKRPF